MKLLVIAGIGGGAALLASPAPARACGVPDVGGAMATVAQALVGRTEAVSTPLVAVAAGASTDGLEQSITLGWGWGTRDVGGIFPGSSLTRVLLDVRHDTQSSLALTYGWYENVFGSAGLDLGVMADASGAGPTMRLTLGARGIGVRFSTGLTVGHEPHMVSSAEMVVEVLDLAGQI